MKVTSISPPNETTGVPLNSTITVDFDSEIDQLSVNSGTLLLVGPDTNIWVGAVLNWRSIPYPSMDNDVLVSPGYDGFVQGSYTFETIEGSGSSGGQSCTRAIFTPSQPLYPEVSYRVVVVGGEPPNDSFRVITTKTVGTPIASVIGTGVVSVSGSWDDTDDYLHLVVVDDGERGEATFLYYYETSESTTYGPITLKAKHVIGDLTVYFTEGDYVEGDHYRIPLYEPELLETSYSVEFTTGESIEEAPEEESTPVTGPFIPIIPITDMFAPYTESLSTYPMNKQTDVDTSLEYIQIEFTKRLDTDTITTDNISLLSEDLATLVKSQLPISLEVDNTGNHGIVRIYF